MDSPTDAAVSIRPIACERSGDITRTWALVLEVTSCSNGGPLHMERTLNNEPC